MFKVDRYFHTNQKHNNNTFLKLIQQLEVEEQ